MPFGALVIVLVAAVLHAFWNLLAKDARDSAALMWWGVAVGAVWYGGWMVAQAWLGIPREIWLLVAVSIVAEIAYLALITRGYAAGDLSQVYPIARGSPPLLIALFSAVFLGERLPWLGYAGIALLMVGIYFASIPSLAEVWQPLSALSHRPAQWAILAAVTVAVYTTLDKIGVGYSTPLVYNVWVYVGIAVGYAPVAWSRANRASTLFELRTNWRRILVGSVATVGSYVLALVGLAMTSASYVGAVRGTSVVIGALFGWLLLKERFGLVRVLAAATMVVGLALVALAK
ncbi:MAG: DMT family transporter [Chloroflexi bacterium]|nr:DMT family transporter [Chloroflexota bacterium]